ncbi:hypothetical protein ACMFMG_006742 [Clarireedia jacksonii]
MYISASVSLLWKGGCGVGSGANDGWRFLSFSSFLCTYTLHRHGVLGDKGVDLNWTGLDWTGLDWTGSDGMVAIKAMRDFRLVFGGMRAMMASEKMSRYGIAYVEIYAQLEVGMDICVCVCGMS